MYILWSLLPVVIAIQFSFNDGRSRSVWQGFSTQWYCCNEGSVFEDPSMFLALKNSLFLGIATVLVATPARRHARHGPDPLAQSRERRWPTASRWCRW